MKKSWVIALGIVLGTAMASVIFHGCGTSPSSTSTTVTIYSTTS